MIPHDETIGEWLDRCAADRAARAYRTVPFPVFPADQTGRSWCVWCGLRILIPAGRKGAGGPNTRAHWHPGCVDEYRLYTRRADQFDYIAAREGLRCGECGESPERWQRLGECVAYEGKGLPMPRSTLIERRSALEVDHKVPLWSVRDLPDEDRRRYYGPENLWLLCPRDHKAKTRREAAERAASRTPAKP